MSIRQPLVELVHGCLYPLGEKAVDGFSYFGNGRLNYRFLLESEIAEHITDHSILAHGLLFSLRPPNPHPDSGEVLAIKGGNDRVHALVSSRASALPQANFAQGQVEVIIYYQEAAQSDVMPAHQASHGFATEIHKCPGLGQQQLLAPYFADACFSPALSVVKWNRMKPGEVIQAQEADIVAIASISLARVAQANYEFH